MTDTNKPMAGELVTTAPRPKSVLIDMADRYGMEASPFEATVRAICMPPTATREEFAAFLLVAKEYHLNPLTKEIYAFPKRGGGIVPIVSVDGWLSLINSHPACNGFTFTWVQDEKGEPISCTCIMYRKDRSHPVEVTEYLSECYRPTDPWKMKHRMLRHKALIQCGRYAFGFSGIYDEDEGEKIAETRDITPTMRVAPPEPPPDEPEPDKPTTAPLHNSDLPEGGENEVAGVSFVPTGAIGSSESDLLEQLQGALILARDEQSVEEAFDEFDPQTRFAGNTLAIGRAFELKDARITVLATKAHADLEAAGQGTLFGAGGPPAPPEDEPERPFPGDLPLKTRLAGTP